MSYKDYLPHRLLINYSLRKETESLKKQLEEYQLEYNQKMKICQEKIEQATKENEEEYNKIKQDFENELMYEIDSYYSVEDDINRYLVLFYQRKLNNRIIKHKAYLTNLLNKNIKFLDKQMIEIGKEIDLLRERQSLLSAYTNVQDIIDLSNACGYEIDFSSEDSADTLLRKIQNEIEAKRENMNYEKRALIRLRNIVQERSEYIRTIQYIDWIIQLKIDFSKQLNNQKAILKKQCETIKNEIEKADSETESLNDEIKETKNRIIHFWKEPLNILNEEINHYYSIKKEKDDIQEQIDDINSELHDMALFHSNDQYKWDSLKKKRTDLIKERKKLSSKLCDINIKNKKEKRTKWYDIRDNICTAFEKNNIPFHKKKK